MLVDEAEKMPYENMFVWNYLLKTQQQYENMFVLNSLLKTQQQQMEDCYCAWII